jgi:hypothetical protein
MARSSSGLTLLLALGILVAVPVGTMVWYRSWRARLMEPLSPLPTGTAAREHPVAPAAEPPHAELRPVDQLLIGVFEGKGPPPGNDLLPDGPRVDLEAGTGHSVARLDLDRDGKWDEVWTIAPDGIVRAVSPDDDGRQTQKYEWMANNWAPIAAAAE